MSRRLRIAIASALILLGLGLVLLSGVVSLTHTQFGQDRVRSLVLSLLKGRVHGKVYLGRISGNFFNGATIDSVEIRDDEDSAFVNTGPIHVSYDSRDLFDRRILLSHVSVDHPRVVLRQHENGEWNYRRVFPASVQKQQRNARGFGDFIVIDSADVSDAALRLTMPWHPDKSLSRRELDSTINFNLTRKDHDIRRTREGFARSWHWSGANANLGYTRLADPDSTGRYVTIRNSSVNSADPPFNFRNVKATLLHVGDSVWLASSHWDLPRSTGSARGKVVWGSDLPVRYDVHVTGDSVSLSDVAWVYPTLPTTGGGRMDLQIRTPPKNMDFLDFVITKMDVRSTRSHLLGSMTYRLGGDVLIVKDVALQADPVNFDLLRTLNGKKFPYDWQGDITGNIRAPGGPLDHFKVEQSALTFSDAHVPGAMTKLTGRGELNILFPAFTAFHSFAVGIETLDLRTLQYLNPLFPRVKGTVSGVATLDSSWLDVRFRDALLVHHDGGLPESRAQGSGRVTWGEKFLTYDLALNASPISFTTLAHSYGALPLRGEYSGPILVKGTSENLRVVTTLTGPAGVLGFDGFVDTDPPVYGVRGTAQTTAVDLQTLLGNTRLPATRLNGTYALDLHGSTVDDLAGSLSAELARSTIADIRVDPSMARLHFGQGLLGVDTLALRAIGFTGDASGTVAMSSKERGSLKLRLAGDSIGSVARLLPPKLAASLPDSLHGSLEFVGTLASAGPRMDLAGKVTGTEVGVGARGLKNVSGVASVSDFGGAGNFNVSLAGTQVTVGAVRFDSASLSVVRDSTGGTFTGELLNKEGVNADYAGRFVSVGDTTRVDVAKLDVVVDKANSYSLGSPARLDLVPGAVLLDSLVLKHSSNARLIVQNMRLSRDSIRGRLRTDSVDIGLFRALVPTLIQAHGGIVADVEFSGSVKQPQLFGQIAVADGSATLSNLGTHLEHIAADVQLAGDSVHIKRLSAETMKERRGSISVNGSISFERYDNPGFNLRLVAQNFHAIESPGLASLDISTGPTVSLTGSLSSALLRGSVRVERGTIYIPELIRKNVVDLTDPEFRTAVDTILARNRAVLPRAPTNLAENLTLENVRIQIGPDVWLRSSEANIELGGSLDVALGRARNGESSQLTLEGTLSADKGTYRLNLVDPFVQPIFDVETGTLRFFGTPDLNPSLDIRAIHTVRQPRQSANGRDVRVRVTISGSLAEPQLALDNPDNLPLSQSDLLSYLVTGEPAIGFANTSSEYGSQLASVALRYGGTLLSSAIPRNLLDIVELQTASVGTTAATAAERAANPYLSSLLNSRAILGKQIGSRWFLSLSTGLCFVNPTFFKENLGLQLEYRISSTYSAQGGLEPGSSDAVCGPATTRSLQQTPPQLGLDFFRTWRF